MMAAPLRDVRIEGAIKPENDDRRNRRGTLGAQTGMDRLAVAVDFVRMNADNGRAIAQMLDAANQNAKALVAEGIGTNLDISA
jgi:hypothetical protein